MTSKIIALEWGRLEAMRPRHAGSNARIGAHGLAVRAPILRVTTDDGATGFGSCWAGPDKANSLLGRRLDEVFSLETGVSPDFLPFEYALWDLAGQKADRPVYALAADIAGATPTLPYTAPCYDTSLYMDDLHLDSDEEGAALIAGEAREGYEAGHRAFKLKVGRGARHMSLEAGTRRDIAVIKAVREAIGTKSKLLLDANNGWNLNLTKHVLEATAACDVFWIEEPFHEDAAFLRELRSWLNEQHLPCLIAEGEGEASPSLLNWARDGLVDVVQYDIFGHGFTRWLETGQQLDEWGVRSAPHHYAGLIGNYVACHLAGAIRCFSFVEWDEAVAPGLDASGYSLCDGRVCVPDAPGFGLALDEGAFRQAVAVDGWTLKV